MSEALDLQETVERTGKLFCLTHNYTGYPMVKAARNLVFSGEIGNIRKVIVEYLQGWLASPLELSDNRQAAWRSDPAKAGIAGAMADIGTHAFNLAEYIIGKEVVSLSAKLHSTVPGRILDDDGTVSLTFQCGISGTLIASQAAAGEENNLSIRIYGEKGGLIWRQMEPNTLLLLRPDAHAQVIRTGTSVAGMDLTASIHTRLPAGHPEGFIEAFANLYRNFALNIIAVNEGQKPDLTADYPGINEGVRGMKFLEAVVSSSQSGSVTKTL